MFLRKIKNASGCLHFIQYKLGEWFFPLLEPVFRMIENKDPMIKQHFDLALENLEQRKIGAALLNLNMTLNLKPNHFLARIYRGRVFVMEGRALLASEDYIKAHMINRYRFIHYDLYREYFRSMKKETIDLGMPETWNFKQVFEALRQTHDHISRETIKMESPISGESIFSAKHFEKEESPLPTEVLNHEEQDKFDAMGPITQAEIEAIDWDKLIKKLTW